MSTVSRDFYRLKQARCLLVQWGAKPCRQGAMGAGCMLGGSCAVEVVQQDDPV